MNTDHKKFDTSKTIAESNFSHFLENNKYPGRVLVIGQNDIGHLVTVYAIMGRSESSQKRLLETDGINVKTVPIDLSKIRKPELLIYNAMVEAPDHEGRAFVVSNGAQTDAIAKELSSHGFQLTLQSWSHENDEPNYTPRISGIIYAQPNRAPKFCISIIRPHEANSDKSLHVFHDDIYLAHGQGACITTYSGNSDPLPPFKSTPFKVPIVGDAKKICERYRNSLNPEFFVSIAVKVTDPATLESKIEIINRFE